MVEEYRNNIKTGPYFESYKGAIIVSGQFASGKKTGEWIHRSVNGETEARTTWKGGHLHGLAEMKQSSGKAMRLRFEDGALREIDGRKVATSAPTLTASIAADSTRLGQNMRDEAAWEFLGTPLKDALQVISDKHALPVGWLRVDHTTVDADLPITLNLYEIDLLSALTVLAESHGMWCDYRYGCLWVTGPANGQEWVDPTGVSEIHPALGSDLAAAWSEPVTINTIKATSTTQPLATILTSLESQVTMEIDSTQVETSPGHPQDYSTTLHLDKMPFHQVLGVLLYETVCRCELHGDKLIVTPSEGARPPEK